MPDATGAPVPGNVGPDELEPVLDVLRPFLGVEPPRPELDTILATVLFADVVDSTTKQADLGDRAWKDLVERHHGVVREALARWHGIENDTAGAGFYASFDGPRGRSDPRWRSPSACGRWASRSAPACIPGSASWSRARRQD
jgi:class 3 adenylate cyclase